MGGDPDGDGIMWLERAAAVSLPKTLGGKRFGYQGTLRPATGSQRIANTYGLEKPFLQQNLHPKM